MKKYLFTLALALSATFFGFAADCSVVAEVVVSSFEDKYGCLDSDSYNDFYNSVYTRCMELQSEE